MKEIAVGLALMWLVVLISRKPMKFEGWLSLAFMFFIAWGLGNVFFAFVK